MRRLRMQYRFRTHTTGFICEIVGHIAIMPFVLGLRRKPRIRFRCWCGALRSRKFGLRLRGIRE